MVRPPLNRSGFKTFPRTQPRRWGKPFNPQNTRCIPAVKRIFPALILAPIENFETTSKTWFQNLPSNPNIALTSINTYPIYNIA